jgi:hypothetical protein
MITYTREWVFPHVAIVSDPQTDDMRTMIDDIQRVEPVLTLPKRVVDRMAKEMTNEMDRSILRAIRGW